MPLFRHNVYIYTFACLIKVLVLLRAFLIHIQATYLLSDTLYCTQTATHRNSKSVVFLLAHPLLLLHVLCQLHPKCKIQALINQNSSTDQSSIYTSTTKH